MPYLTQVLQGKRSVLKVFGSDYPTPDGTGVRDYIHVMDLGSGHISAVRKLEEYTGCGAYNLGTGKGTSVLELVKAMERASGKRIPLVYKDRRPGDCASIYASTEKANMELRWRAQFDVAKMCEDQWRWAQYSKQLEED
ncbi:hypothetical protein CBR_g19899 [Chara braunii]|uniref:UDP-glucose 4-epimerase n=1 Tax=Chara braunii TaxID=69332 RepID=A0A388KYY9_CHABU|nr:hypothetical protein CBR_g19899 [Chara braunii]|eukprot:GBG75265.1 hypothetical protein CBR_g19899 [Chara braunii]